MNETYVTLTGIVATVPEVKQHNGTRLVSFRFVATERRFDRGSGSWVNGAQTWSTVTCWRTLAVNVAESVRVKDRVIIKGRLRTEEWTAPDGAKRSAVKITADTVGHDLGYGTTTFERSRTSEAAEIEAVVARLEADVADLPVELPDDVDGVVVPLAPAYAGLPPREPDEEEDLEDEPDDDEEEAQGRLLVGAGAR